MQHTGLTRSTCLMLHRRARDWPRTPWYLFRREGSPMACLIVSRQSALAESGHVSDSQKTVRTQPICKPRASRPGFMTYPIA